MGNYIAAAWPGASRNGLEFLRRYRVSGEGAVQRIANPFEKPVHIIEVQCGDYLGEDDIVRLEDKTAGKAPTRDAIIAGPRPDGRTHC